MLSMDAYGTGLGEWSYGRPSAGVPSQAPYAQQKASKPAGQRSAYQPGQAQPVQPQSQGTPYSAYQPAGRYMNSTPEYMAANPDTQPYRPARGQGDVTPEAMRGGMGEPPHSRPQGGPSVMGWPDPSGSGQRPPSPPAGAAKPTRTTSSSFTPGGGAGNLAYAPPDQRPSPFTTSVNFGGNRMDPGQFINQRDAFIQNINDARRPFAMNPRGGRPQMDFGSMWNRAGDMVANGWQNPLTGLMGQPQGRFMAPPGSNAKPPAPPPGAGWVY